MHSSTGLSKQMTKKDLRKELCWILLQSFQRAVLEDTSPQQNPQQQGTAAQVSHWKQDTAQGIKPQKHESIASYKIVLLSLYSSALSQKAPIYIHRADTCSCFKALPCPSNLLGSQEELADLNRGLSQ